MLTRYGKPSAPVLSLKQSFFTDNDALLKEQARIHATYTAQPARTRCKNCDGPLGAVDFTKAGVGYIFCKQCTHVNGAHQDTDAFCNALYTEDGGAKYATNYTAADREAYEKRVRDIYQPKADFLKEAVGPVRIADIGSGSGHFVAALMQAGFDAQGFEVSEAQVGLARQMVQSGKFTRHHLNDTVNIARAVDAETISMIGVLEHIPDARGVLSAVRDNPKVRYLYLSVPLFSPSVFFEAAFPNVMARHLSTSHTHIYTEQSLAWMGKEFGFELIGEWWFGGDVMDLFRSVYVSLPETLRDRWRETFGPVIDDLQFQIDVRHMASEVHQVLRRV
jgi:SAM-dependent methyltransferase